MTSGDIGANEALMHQHMKSWADGIEPYNPLNTGEGHLIAEAIGAKILPRKDQPAEIAAHILRQSGCRKYPLTHRLHER
jgi:hypothetical protein